MSLCAACGLPLFGEVALCPHHHCAYGDDWAASNRIMCNFIHRGVVPPRVLPGERNEDLWGSSDREVLAGLVGEREAVEQHGRAPVLVEA